MSVEWFARCPCCQNIVRWSSSVGTTVGGTAPLYRIDCDRKLS